VSEKRKLLLIEDDSGLQSQMRWALAQYDVAVAGDRQSALELVRGDAGPFPVVVLDLGLPPDENGASEGLGALTEILAFAPSTKVIIASGNEDRANAVKAIGIGAYDFYAKPVDVDVLALIIDRAWQLYQLEEENRALTKGQGAPLAGIMAASPEMLKVCRQIEKIAGTDVGVLLFGESGTGKEALARAVHDLSRRANKPFVAINCASIPENLLESELFGHEKGAFTGAIKQTLGKVEMANDGTLFLDEIGDLPLSLQAKLLRFLQEKKIERIGGRQTISVNVRVVSATNRDLQKMIKDGGYREDLYYRLNELSIDIPPLRMRQGDILLLANYFLGRFNRLYNRAVRGFDPAAVAAMSQHAWPGNVRELENRLKRAVVMAEGKLIAPADLDFAGPAASPDESLNLKDVRERAERNAIQQALLQAQGNVSKTAKILGITRPTLYHLIKTLDIKI
jgi:two-component system NtrC family response regulator